MEEADGQTMEDDIVIEGKQNPVPSQLVGDNNEVQDARAVGGGNVEVRRRSIPPPGDGQKIYEIDPILKDFRAHLDFR